MADSKADIRQKLIQRMQHLSSKEVARTSRRACAAALGAYDWSKCTTVLAYTPLTNSGEIDPCYLLEALSSDTVITYVGSDKAAPLPQGKYDVILVPVVGYTSEHYRLGRGGGWYDRLLAAHPESMSIGLVYSWAKVDFSPDLHDKQLSMIITDETVAI